MDLQLIKSSEAIDLEVKERAEEAKLVAEQAGGFEISNADGVQLAKNNIITIRKTVKDINDIRISITVPLDVMKKEVKALYDAPVSILNDALATYSMKMQVFLAAEAKKAEGETRKQMAIADEKTRKDKEKLEKKAVKAEEKGKTETAAALREQKEMVVPEVPVISVTPQLPKGSYWKETWTADVIDIDKLPREYMIPNQKGLDSIAAATKGTAKIPSVVFKKERKLVNRA